jgi:hypothetical protein
MDIETGDPRATRALEVPGLARRTEALLRAGVPLTLLIDLADDDPHSRDRYVGEGGDASWLRVSPAG